MSWMVQYSIALEALQAYFITGLCWKPGRTIYSTIAN